MSATHRPTALRWTLVGLTAVAVYALIGVLLETAVDNLQLSTEARRILIAVVGAAAAFLTVAIPSRIAPARRPAVALVLAVLVLTLNVVLFVTATSRSGLMSHVFIPQLVGTLAAVFHSRITSA